MNFQHTSVCASLIATSFFAFSATSAQAIDFDPNIHHVEFNFLKNVMLGDCDKASGKSSCITEAEKSTNNPLSGFKIESYGGKFNLNLDKKNESNGLGIGKNGFINDKEYLKLTLPKLDTEISTLQTITLGSLSSSSCYDSVCLVSFSVEGYLSNGISIGTPQEYSILSKSTDNFILQNPFEGSLIASLKLKAITTKDSKKSKFKLVGAYAESVTTPESNPATGMLGLLTVHLFYKGINRLIKPQKRGLLK